jgi:hypothetical protein
MAATNCAICPDGNLLGRFPSNNPVDSQEDAGSRWPVAGRSRRPAANPYDWFFNRGVSSKKSLKLNPFAVPGVSQSALHFLRHVMERPYRRSYGKLARLPIYTIALQGRQDGHRQTDCRERQCSCGFRGMSSRARKSVSHVLAKFVVERQGHDQAEMFRLAARRKARYSRVQGIMDGELRQETASTCLHAPCRDRNKELS